MPQTIQRSFTSGEIAPALRSRADLTKYTTGLALCENFIIRAQGGAYSRPGLKFIGALDDSTRRARLIPFSFNTEQTYILVFEHLKIRVIKAGGYVLKPAATITGITQANPAVVTTSAAHTFITGESVTITGVVGMTELNGNTYQITVLTPTTFQLDGVDSTGFGAYVSGGSAQSDGIFELATPYIEADIPRIGFTQSADIMTLVHPDYDPRNLSRLADDDWTLAVISYAPTVATPGFSGIVTAVITNITQADPAVVTTSAAHGFITGNPITIENVVGMTEINDKCYEINVLTATTFELVDTDTTTFTAYSSAGDAYRQATRNVGTGFGSNNKRYQYVVTAVDVDGVESLPSSVVARTVGSLTETAGIRVSWNKVAAADYYRVYKTPAPDTEVYGWIGDSRRLCFEDFNIAPVTSDAPPSDRQPFTGTGNKPAAVNYYQQRQIFANTINEPQTVFTTQTGNYQSFRTSSPARADDAVTFTIAGRQVNEIRHIIGLDSLILLTSGGEWKVTEGRDQVLTPSTIGIRIQSYNGASWVPPVVVNDTVIYTQDKGARIRDLNYEFSNDKYSGNDLSIMSEHLFEGYEIEEMTFASEPYSIVWCVRSDGRLLGLTYQREHQVWGWHQHVTDGTFESVATIGEGNRDAVYTIVNRTINGSTVRYVERFETRMFDTAEECFCVDSGLTYTGTAATVISGLDHLEGEEVVVLADGNVVRGLTVASGQITIPNESTTVHVGLEYIPVLETLDLDIASTADTLKAKRLSVSRVDIEVENSRGGWIGPKKDDGSNGTIYEIKPRYDTDFYDAIALQTRKHEIFIDPQWQKTGAVRIEQRDPLPLTILSIIPNVDVGG